MFAHDTTLSHASKSFEMLEPLSRRDNSGYGGISVQCLKLLRYIHRKARFPVLSGSRLASMSNSHESFSTCCNKKWRSLVPFPFQMPLWDSFAKFLAVREADQAAEASFAIIDCRLDCAVVAEVWVHLLVECRVYGMSQVMCAFSVSQPSSH